MSDSRSKFSFGTVLELILLVLLAVGGLNYQYLLDQYALATFKPAPAMAAIEPKLGLTQLARGIFYSSQAQVDSKAAFNADCDPAKGELELGCYFHNRIYVLQIDNPSLQPEMEVTAAHELLHAAWTRLSTTKRNQIGSELERVYHSLNDSDLNTRMAAYAKSEPGEEANELHSILGTEEITLPADLETYYRQYFTSRSVIAADHAQYVQVFAQRKAELANQLAVIRALKAQLAVLDAHMAALRASGDISDYNALVPRQNALVNQINSLIDAYQTGVDEYNALSASLDSQSITDTETQVQ